MELYGALFLLNCQLQEQRCQHERKMDSGRAPFHQNGHRIAFRTFPMEERSVGGWSRKRILFHGMNTGLCWKFREGRIRACPTNFHGDLRAKCWACGSTGSGIGHPNKARSPDNNGGFFTRKAFPIGGVRVSHLIPGGNKQAVDRLDGPGEQNPFPEQSATQPQPQQPRERSLPS